MKKTILVLASTFMMASLFIGCQHDAGNEGGGTDNASQTKKYTQPDLELDGLNPNESWAYVKYNLSEFAEKEVTIDFSADMKVVNNTTEDYKIWWQINNDPEFPSLTEETANMFAPGTSEKNVTGNATLKINSGAVLYLTTHNTTADVKIYVTNIKYTISYVGSANKEDSKPAKQFPTDIFVVGEEGTCGIQIGDGELEPFQLYEENSAEKQNDGSMIWTSTATGGGAGGATFYIKSDKTEINIANYESIEIEFVYSPITGKWASKAQNPGFCLRLLPWDSTGLFGGTVDVAYFQDDNNADGYGTCTKTFPISDDLKNQIIASASQDSVVGFGLKFNDYERGNEEGDQIKIQLKKVKFNKKAGAPEDKPFDDGLTEDQRGSVVSIEYPTQDYTMESNPVKYNKHAWVYLPAGYDANDKETKYPVFILLHGALQNENTWGLSNKGRGGRIKGFMDRGMADGSVEKFILVCATGVASKNWGPNGSGNDWGAFFKFGGELRNDLLPYLRENYNVAEGRDNVALAGLSFGGLQTIDIGIGECLDLVSYFGAFSAATSVKGEEFFPKVDENFPDYDINYLYMICGDQDFMGKNDDGTGTAIIDTIRTLDSYITTTGWSKLGDSIATQRYHYTEVPGGAHDFPVWYQGFQEFIPLVFK